MPRPPEVRWSKAESCWVSDVGEVVTDRSGRRRRKRVYFREDESGPIPFGAKPRSEAYRRAAEALRQFITSSRVQTIRTGPSAAGVCRAYLDHCRARVASGDLRPSSFASIREALSVFVDWPENDPLGNRWADEVGPADVFAFLRGRVGTSGHYARRIVSTVRACWAWAAAEGLIPSDPLATVKRPKAPVRTGRRPDREAFGKWLRKAWAEARSRPRHRRANRVALLLIRAIASTGARPGELCRARWAEFDWPSLSLVPSEHKLSGRGKPRRIFFPWGWSKTLRVLRQHHPDFVFVHGQHRPRHSGAVRLGDEAGEPWNPAALATWARRWGMPCTLYDLRRLVASELADSGLDYGRIGDLLGNSADLVRSVYSSRSVESLRSDFDRGRSGQR